MNFELPMNQPEERGVDDASMTASQRCLAETFPHEAIKNTKFEPVSTRDDDRGYWSERLDGRVWVPGTSEREANRIADSIVNQLRLPGGFVRLDTNEIQRTALGVPNLDTFISHLTRRLAPHGLSAELVTTTDPGQENRRTAPTRRDFLQMNGFNQPVRIPLRVR